MIAASFVVICHHICVLVSFYLITNEWEVQSMITLKNGRLKKGTQVPPLTRGQVAAQEPLRILREALASKRRTTTEQVPQTRGLIAAQEQKKILREVATAASKGEAQIPQTRGQVAAQEQMRIIGQYIDNMSVGYKEVSIPI
jgi:tRNA U34 5-carboxymethylaminomethyl modifying GTPase MnmE/TrmE